MQKQPGQSLSEYGIIVGLVAVAAIPAIMFLSGAVGSGLQGVRPFRAVVPPSATPSSAVATADSPLSPASETRQSAFQAAYDPETGKISYQLPASSGGGTHTASVEGATRSMMNELLRLADAWETSQGQPLPPDIKRFIKNLAASGFNLADAQQTITDFEAFMETPSQIPLAGGLLNGLADATTGTWNLNDLKAQAGDFTRDYNELAPRLTALAQDSPDYGQLKAVIDGYAGVISYANYRNFIASADTYTAESAYVVGTKPGDAVATPDTPAITSASSQGIDDTAK